MRHAESPFITQQQDIERALSPVGKTQAKEMGGFLQEKGLLPDVILASIAQRTMQTARLLCIASGISEEQIQLEERLYNASPEQIEEVIIHAELPEAIQNVLILAHNPGISQFASICSQETKYFSFVPSAMAGFDLNGVGEWASFSTQNTAFSFYQQPKNI